MKKKGIIMIVYSLKNLRNPEFPDKLRE